MRTWLAWTVLAERLSPSEVGVVHDVPVTLDVAALAADDEEREVLRSGGVRESPWRRRLDVDETARPELAHLFSDLHTCDPAVDEVQLVLRVVIVEEALVAGRIHDSVHAERCDTERLPHLAEAVTFAEFVERSERVA